MALQPPKRFWLPKAGNRPDEYEDAARAVYPQRIGVSGRRTVRVVVADGASESAFAREWANILTDAFVDRPLDLRNLTEEALSAWLAAAQAEWHDCVPWDRVPWHGEAKARAGAFASLLGLTVRAAPHDPRQLRWQAVAVGDSCFFIVRSGRLQFSFPLEDAAQFDNTPALVCSNPANAGELWEEVRRGGGQCAWSDDTGAAHSGISDIRAEPYADTRTPESSIAPLAALATRAERPKVGRSDPGARLAGTGTGWHSTRANPTLAKH